MPGCRGGAVRTGGGVEPPPAPHTNSSGEGYGRLMLVLSPLLLMVKTPDAVEV
jgi:hypothetical protein